MSDGLRLEVNGEARTLAVTTVAELVAALGREGAGVAVAVNDAVVRRGEWSERRLRDGDRVEVVGAVQGG